MFSSTRPSGNRNDASYSSNRNYSSNNRFQSDVSNNRFQSDASGNRFQSETSYSSNRNYNQGNRFQSDNRPNIFNMKPRQPELPEPKPVPPISEFPSLLRQSPKAVLTPVQASVLAPAPASAYAKIAQQAASIVVPVPEPPKKQKPVEQQINIINMNQLKKIRMTMPEYLERKEYGEELDDDMISICSEYSNNIDENDDDSDDDDNC
jgi:hypothetical protein